MNARTNRIVILLVALFGATSGVLWSQSQPESPTIDFGFRPEKPKPKTPGLGLPACKDYEQIEKQVFHASHVISEALYLTPTDHIANYGAIDDATRAVLNTDYDKISEALLACVKQASSRGYRKTANLNVATLNLLHSLRGDYWKEIAFAAWQMHKELASEEEGLAKRYNALVDEHNNLLKSFDTYISLSTHYDDILEMQIRQLDGRIRENESDRIAYQRILSNLSRPVFIRQWAPPQPVEPLTCSGSSIDYGYGITTTSFNCH